MKRENAKLFIALVSLVSASAQTVPVAGMAQQMVGREFGGVDCQTGKPTGFGTAALWFPYIAGIPLEFLFKTGATAQNETTAVLTATFDLVQPYVATNDTMTNISFKPHHLFYYYHPNSSPKDWTDFDGFQAGQLVGTLDLQRIMFSVPPLGGMSYGVNSGPWSYTKDFKLPNGTVVNLANFTAGITVHFVGMIGSFVDDPEESGASADCGSHALSGTRESGLVCGHDGIFRPGYSFGGAAGFVKQWQPWEWK